MTIDILAVIEAAKAECRDGKSVDDAKRVIVQIKPLIDILAKSESEQDDWARLVCFRAYLWNKIGRPDLAIEDLAPLMAKQGRLENYWSAIRAYGTALLTYRPWSAIDYLQPLVGDGGMLGADIPAQTIYVKALLKAEREPQVIEHVTALMNTSPLFHTYGFMQRSLALAHFNLGFDAQIVDFLAPMMSVDVPFSADITLVFVSCAAMNRSGKWYTAYKQGDLFYEHEREFTKNRHLSSVGLLMGLFGKEDPGLRVHKDRLRREVGTGGLVRAYEAADTWIHKITYAQRRAELYTSRPMDERRAAPLPQLKV